jgi:hypothetical protein
VPDQEGLTVGDSGGKIKSSNIDSTGQKVVVQDEASDCEKDDDIKVYIFSM